jgi:hypothetical protein
LADQYNAQLPQPVEAPAPKEEAPAQ